MSDPERIGCVDCDGMPPRASPPLTHVRREHVVQLHRELAALREALAEVLAWGVVLDDPRLDYVEVQVSRGAVDYARDVLAGREPSVLAEGRCP